MTQPSSTTTLDLTDGQVRVQITIRPTCDEYAILEQLRQLLGAPSCSALVVAALEEYLAESTT